MTRTGNILRLSLIVFVTLAALLLIAFTGLANWFDEEDRKDILLVNAFDAPAMIAELSRDIDRLAEGKGGNFVALREKALRYAARVPLNADLRALVADLALRNGDTGSAKRYIKAALKLDRTNALAIRRSFYLAELSGRYASSISLLDPVFRRNPARILDFQDIIESLLDRKESYEGLLAVLEREPPWLEAVFYQTALNQQNLPALAQLLIDFRPQGVRNFDTINASIMRSLFSDNQYEAAHRLFVLTMSAEDKERGGYIFNGDLSTKPSARLFDWSFATNQSVDIEWRQHTGRPEDGELRVSFANKPVRKLHLTQQFRLLTGRYKVAVLYSTAGLAPPAPLAWQLICLEPKDSVFLHAVETGTHGPRTAYGYFSVQSPACRTHSFRLSTQARVYRYEDRYEGSLSLLGVEITPVSGPADG